MVMNELLDKDTTAMTIKELGSHVNTTLTALHSILIKRGDQFHELFKKGSWYSDNQSPGIRAGTMALYQLHVGEGILTIKGSATGEHHYTVCPNRKNPINFYYRNSDSGHHSFDAYDLVKETNYMHDPKDVTFELDINGKPCLPAEAKVKGRRFLDAYVLMDLVCNGGQYQRDNMHKIFSETLMKTDGACMFESSIYSPKYKGNSPILGLEDSFTAQTIAHAYPPIKFDSIREYILTDEMKKTVFVNYIVPAQSDKRNFISITGNKELLRDYWASFLSRNYHRTRDEFMNETFEITRKAMLDTLDAQQLGKVI